MTKLFLESWKRYNEGNALTFSWMDADVQYQLDQLNSDLSYYFDWPKYHRDASLDLYEASNGVCLI